MENYHYFGLNVVVLSVIFSVQFVCELDFEFHLLIIKNQLNVKFYLFLGAFWNVVTFLAFLNIGGASTLDYSLQPLHKRRHLLYGCKNKRNQRRSQLSNLFILFTLNVSECAILNFDCSWLAC